jgi:hypothetical protein
VFAIEYVSIVFPALLPLFYRLAFLQYHILLSLQSGISNPNKCKNQHTGQASIFATDARFAVVVWVKQLRRKSSRSPTTGKNINKTMPGSIALREDT